MKKILWPTDFSELSYKALETADELALHFSAELILIHVVILPLVPYPRPPAALVLPEHLREMKVHARQMFEELAAEKISNEVVVRTRIEVGNPPERIAEIAAGEKVELIVIATHGLSGWRRFIFGSVAERVIRLAPCPVLSIQYPPEEEQGSPKKMN
jgi:nucleotide-binding universal stress UspA family protein